MIINTCSSFSSSNSLNITENSNIYDNYIIYEKNANIINSAIESLINKNLDIIKYVKNSKKITYNINQINIDSLNKLRTIYKNYKKNSFYLDTYPKINLNKYIERMFYYSCIEASTSIIILCYIDRIIKNGFLLTYNNVHLTFLACFLISIKINEDYIIDYKYIANIAYTTTFNLVIIESDMLQLLDYNLLVSQEEYFKYQLYFLD